MIAAEAPMPVRRAAAVLLAVTRQVQQRDHGGAALTLHASDITVHADGSVELSSAATHTGASPGDVDTRQSPDAAGASIGRLFFELLVGREPVDRTDAFEPALTEMLSPSICALLAQSFSPAEGQWPALDEWSTVLDDLAGGQATSPTAAELRRARRRTVLVFLGVAILAAVTVAVLLAAPHWWDEVNESARPTSTVTQP